MVVDHDPPPTKSSPCLPKGYTVPLLKGLWSRGGLRDSPQLNALSPSLQNGWELEAEATGVSRCLAVDLRTEEELKPSLSLSLPRSEAGPCNTNCQACDISIGPDQAMTTVIQYRNVLNIPVMCFVPQKKRTEISRRASHHHTVEMLFLLSPLFWEHCPVS